MSFDRICSSLAMIMASIALTIVLIALPLPKPSVMTTQSSKSLTQTLSWSDTVKETLSPPPITITFSKAPGWTVTHGPFGAGLFGRRGFTAILTPPHPRGYTELRCNAKNRDNVIISSSWDNWLNVPSSVQVVPYFDEKISTDIRSVICTITSDEVN